MPSTAGSEQFSCVQLPVRGPTAKGSVPEVALGLVLEVALEVTFKVPLEVTFEVALEVVLEVTFVVAFLVAIRPPQLDIQPLVPFAAVPGPTVRVSVQKSAVVPHFGFVSF